jgi:hypothetical protein
MIVAAVRPRVKLMGGLLVGKRVTTTMTALDLKVWTTLLRSEASSRTVLATKCDEATAKVQHRMTQWLLMTWSKSSMTMILRTILVLHSLRRKTIGNPKTKGVAKEEGEEVKDRIMVTISEDSAIIWVVSREIISLVSNNEEVGRMITTPLLATMATLARRSTEKTPVPQEGRSSRSGGSDRAKRDGHRGMGESREVINSRATI